MTFGHCIQPSDNKGSQGQERICAFYFEQNKMLKAQLLYYYFMAVLRFGLIYFILFFQNKMCGQQMLKEMAFFFFNSFNCI